MPRPGRCLRRAWFALLAVGAAGCPETGNDTPTGDGGATVIMSTADAGGATDTQGNDATGASDAQATDAHAAGGGQNRCTVARLRVDGQLREATCARGLVPIGGPLHELTLQLPGNELLRIQLPGAATGRHTAADCLDASLSSPSGAYQANLSGRNLTVEAQRRDDKLSGSFSGDLCRVIATIVIDGRVSHSYACRTITEGSFDAPIEPAEPPCGCSVPPADDAACFVPACAAGACMPRICPLGSAACAAGAPRPTGTFRGVLAGRAELLLGFDAAGNLQRLSFRHPELRGVPPEPPAEVAVDYVLDPVPASAVLMEGARSTLATTSIPRTTGEPPDGRIFLQWQARRTAGGAVELSVHGAFTHTPLVFGNNESHTETLSGTLH
jgi:hypothetical protein